MKGFTEVLIADLRVNAPHIICSVVMPGPRGDGQDVSAMSDEDVQKAAALQLRRFSGEAPTTAAQVATIILDGVEANRWRILVGEDAKRLARRRHQYGDQVSAAAAAADARTSLN